MNYKKLIFCAILVVLFSGVKAQDKTNYKKEVFTQNNDTLLYRVMYPKNFSVKKQYPVVLFLHGAGERGNDNEKQLTHGSSLLSNSKNRRKFPAIVIFPQCPENEYWANVSIDRSIKPLDIVFQYEKEPTKPLRLVMLLLDDLLRKSFVKKDQIYLMGLSMGGMGTFELAYRRPNVFAAAIPICGGGNPKYAKEFAGNVPLWAFHGALDNVVNPNYTLEMVSAILKEGGTPKLTIYDDANHNSWDSAFAEPNLLPWLFSKKRIKN